MDYAKGVSILLVVVFHVVNGLVKRRPIVDVPLAWESSVNPIFELVRMPLFFFVSGLFVARSCRKPARIVVADKLRTIAWPYLIWTVVQATLISLLASRAPADAEIRLASLPYHLVVNPVFQFWFLYALFLSLMLYLMLVKLGLRAWAIVAVAAGLNWARLNVNFHLANFDLSGYYVSLADWSPLFQAMDFFLYMAIGSAIGEAVLRRMDRARIATLVAIAVSGIALASWAVVSLDLRRGATTNIYGQGLPIDLPFTFASIAVGLAVAALIARSGIAEFVRTAGQFSLYIFVLHVICAAGVRTVLLRSGVTDFLVHAVVGVVVGVVVPIWIAVASRRFHFGWLFRLRTA